MFGCVYSQDRALDVKLNYNIFHNVKYFLNVVFVLLMALK